jgi:biotin-(acetyl-CoA carboxylase) ligase
LDIAADVHREALTRDDAAVDVLHAVSHAASAWLRGEHDLDDYRARCITLGRRVSVTTVAGADSWQGVAVGVDDTGLLLVRGTTGAVTAVSAGDVTLAE